MTVELERKFYKWYKRINISCDEQKTTNRYATKTIKEIYD